MKPTPTIMPIEYPDSDGQPMAENTVQFRWIVTIKENLDALFASNPDVFVAGDLFWYPVEGRPDICYAPDVLVAIGRPKGDRGSYKQWEEDGIAPQVAFEVLSPSNRPGEMARKFEFYDLHGVEEYYVYDPDRNTLTGWLREDGRLRDIPAIDGWTSPRLGIRFECGETLTVRKPDGTPFLTVAEIIERSERLQREREQAERDRKLSDWEKTKAIAEKEKAIADRERERTEKEKALAEKAASDRLAQERAEEIARLLARLQAVEKGQA